MGFGIVDHPGVSALISFSAAPSLLSKLLSRPCTRFVPNNCDFSPARIALLGEWATVRRRFMNSLVLLVRSEPCFRLLSAPLMQHLRMSGGDGWQWVVAGIEPVLARVKLSPNSRHSSRVASGTAAASRR